MAVSKSARPPTAQRAVVPMPMPYQGFADSFNIGVTFRSSVELRAAAGRLRQMASWGGNPNLCNTLVKVALEYEREAAAIDYIGSKSDQEADDDA